MAIKMYKVETDYNSLPGDTIRESLEEINMTQSELAENMGTTRKHISEVISGKTRILPETANQLEYVFDVPAKFWLNLQLQYDDFLEKKRNEKELEENNEYSKKFPYTELSKAGLVPNTKNKSERLDNILKFFRVSSIEVLKKKINDDPLSIGAFRASDDKFKVNNYSLHSWLQAGIIKANNIETEDFDAKKLKTLIPEFRRLSLETDIKKFFPKLQKLAASTGIAVVIVPELPKSRVSGCTRWLSPYPKAVIELSIRQKTHDNFWFTFFHELGHIVLHKKSPFFTINQEYGKTNEEKEADNWAANVLIPKKSWESFIEKGDFTRKSIELFANSIDIHEDIVLGRLQNEKYLDYRQLSNLHVRYKFAK
ncbi:HigA family addiction module antitoxin [Companilactobacillus ginsenosidimutans]|uniref:HTH cro/C1-type domain-containing protein n=1 Tax=Companilactobacillus ginsenosidimutans TaxID=1007676 RepID=A0A0H4R176_9LACO|nr:HigA family addiction module antitoxin [Companilactobacillus ginsenosidimutans]AKP67455.1 hypothetical protein ABM34_07870 [Companilactobacillus ginsenosidimutans]